MGSCLKRIIMLLVFVLIFGGIGSFLDLWQGLKEIIKCFFPVFFKVAKMSLENYLTSPYFITGVIMSVFSGFGIWFGVKGGKVLLFVVSVVCEMISLGSILMNVV